MALVTVLYVREDSEYKKLPGVDAYDRKRDARTAAPKGPVVAHPPCRFWGKLRGLAKSDDPEAEMDMARHAVKVIQRNGGVLEHPQNSLLWKDQNLPRPSAGIDKYGGYTIVVDQYDFGHLCKKKTLLYIVGCPEKELPAFPEPNTAPPTHSISGYTARKGKYKGGGLKGTKNVSRKIREMTPPRFAAWLLETARRCTKRGSIVFASDLVKLNA